MTNETEKLDYSDVELNDSLSEFFDMHWRLSSASIIKRCIRCLEAQGIYSLQDLLSVSPASFKLMPNFGGKCLAFVMAALHGYKNSAFAKEVPVIERETEKLDFDAHYYVQNCLVGKTRMTELAPIIYKMQKICAEIDEINKKLSDIDKVLESLCG